MEQVKAMKNNIGLCWKCLKSFHKSRIHTISIPEMGYGSSFDGNGTRVQLCDSCYEESNPQIWYMEENHDLYGIGRGEEYVYEKEMIDYINSLPLEGRQFAENEFTYGWCSRKMKAQDWIDYELGILSHEKCKEYGLYSHQEIKAYEDKFTTCEYVANRIWSDGSKGSCCPFGSSGKYGQICGSISSKCYRCKHYKIRETPIKDIPAKDFKDYMAYLEMKIRYDELTKRFA